MNVLERIHADAQGVLLVVLRNEADGVLVCGGEFAPTIDDDALFVEREAAPLVFPNGVDVDEGSVRRATHDRASYHAVRGRIRNTVDRKPGASLDASGERGSGLGRTVGRAGRHGGSPIVALWRFS